MAEAVIAIAIMACVCMLAATIVSALAWYERYSAQWHHEMMLEAFADGWDAACEVLRQREEQRRG
jgi:hypothetical protein